MKQKKEVGFFTGLILLLTAIILVSIIGAIGFVVETLLRLFKGGLGRFYYDIAYSLDQLGNTICPSTLNFLFKKGEGYKFGSNPDTTVSAVLGLNKVNGSLTWFGKFIDGILELLDSNHSIKSIEEHEEVAFGHAKKGL